MDYKMVVFDTETGGLDPLINSIFSIGAVILENGEIKENHFSVLIAEDAINASNEALKVNGFTVEHIREKGVSVYEAVDLFLDWLKTNGLTKNVILAGHNVGFDLGFLKRLFRLAGRASEFNKIFSWRVVDTQAAAQLLQYADRVKVKSTSLNSMCEATGIVIRSEERHDAVEDAVATAKLFVHMLLMLRKPVEVF